MDIDYLQKILTAKVYDVAIESALDLAPVLSRRIGNRVLLKREDQQPVFSFKLRRAYNKMARLSAAAPKPPIQPTHRHAAHRAVDNDPGGRRARRQGRAARRFVQRRLRLRG